MNAIKITLLILTGCLLNLRGLAQCDGFVRSTDGAKIHYRTFGSGKPLLIINGGPGMNSDGFEGLAKRLSEKYRTIIYDQRGTGRSKLRSLDTNTITMKLMVADIESLRKHLKVKTWSVLGHSFGGMLASYYATTNPGNIDKIILSSSGGIDLGLLDYVQESINSKLTQTQLDSIAFWTKKINEGDTSHYAKLNRGINLAHAYVIDQKFIPTIGERLTQGNITINMLMWKNMQSINFDCADGLKSFKKPVLIIQGKEDIIKTETAEKAHKAFANSRVVYMDHCIHYGWLDNESVYFNEIGSFLNN